MQLRKESLRKSGLPGFEPWPLRYRCSARTNWAKEPTGSWSLNWFAPNQFDDQLPVGSLAQLVRALHRYRRGQGSNPGKPDFFRLSFRNCISCVNNREDLLYISFFIPNIWISYIHNFSNLFLLKTTIKCCLSCTESYCCLPMSLFLFQGCLFILG